MSQTVGLLIAFWGCFGAFEFGVVRGRQRGERWAWRWGYFGGCCAGLIVMCLGMILAEIA